MYDKIRKDQSLIKFIEIQFVKNVLSVFVNATFHCHFELKNLVSQLLIGSRFTMKTGCFNQNFSLCAGLDNILFEELSAVPSRA